MEKLEKLAPFPRAAKDASGLVKKFRVSARVSQRVGLPLRAQTVESLGRLLGGEKLYYRREYDAKHNERLPQHPSQPLLGSKLFRRVRISRSVHLLRLVMAWLCAKGPLKDIRTRAAKAKNVCVILAGSRRF